MLSFLEFHEYKIYEAGLRGMLNYGLEHAYDNLSCDQNYKTFLNTIESTYDEAAMEGEQEEEWEEWEKGRRRN